MNEREKVMYDIMKNPEKHQYELNLPRIYREDGKIKVCFMVEQRLGIFTGQNRLGIFFVLNEDKELYGIEFIDFYYFLREPEYHYFEVDETKEKFEQLWQLYIKKYHLRLKLMFV